MDKDIEKQALEALERQKRAYKRSNDWTTANRERQTVTLPKGTRDRIMALGEKSVNGYINRLIAEDLERRETGTGAGGDTSDPFIENGGGWIEEPLPFA